MVSGSFNTPKLHLGALRDARTFSSSLFFSGVLTPFVPRLPKNGNLDFPEEFWLPWVAMVRLNPVRGAKRFKSRDVGCYGSPQGREKCVSWETVSPVTFKTWPSVRDTGVRMFLYEVIRESRSSNVGRATSGDTILDNDASYEPSWLSFLVIGTMKAKT